MKKFQLRQVIDSSKRHAPLLIAHRGARREAPENTIPAFERAIELGADGIEFDVVLTKDRVPLVTHNDDLSILTHFDGFAHKTPFSMIRSLDFGSHFRPSFSNVTVPTLTEVLELLQPHELSIICELKSQPGLHSHIAELVGGIVSDFRFRKSITISSASLRILFHLKRLYPNIPRALIIKNNRSFSFFRRGLFAKFLKVSEIHPCLPAASRRMVSKAHKNGWWVHAWTVNDRAGIDKCISLGVEGIITDDIAMAQAYIQSKV